MSRGEGDLRGPWNSDENFAYVSDREAQQAVDGVAGDYLVKFKSDESRPLNEMALRTVSDPLAEPVTGAELGMAEGDTDTRDPAPMPTSKKAKV